MRTQVMLAALGLATAARASTPVPMVLSHEGRLLDAQDSPVNGSVQITFELHTTDNPNRHEPKWTETRTVQVSGGLYGVALGDTLNGGTAFTTDLLAEPELYLSVTIGGAELLPRLRVSSTVYALRAGYAAQAGSVAAGGVTADAIADGAITLQKLALTNGKLPALDADTLDGLDSSAFAPASIETQIDAIQTSVGTGLGSAVADVQATLGTPAGASLAADVAALNGQISSTVQTGISNVATQIGTPAGASLAADVAAVSSAVGTVNTAVGTVNGAVATLTTRVGDPGSTSLSAQVAALNSNLGNFNTIGADVASLKTTLGLLSYGIIQTNPGSSCGDILTKNGGRGSGFYWIDPDTTGSAPAAQAWCTMGPDGTSSRPGRSCSDIKNNAPTTGDGVYWVDPDGALSNAAFQVYCDMTTDGGGWTFFAHVNNDYVGARLFEQNVGSYRTDRADDGTTYGKAASILQYFSHSTMMVTIDTAAITTSKIVFYQYSAGHTGFNSGPVPCVGLGSGFSYRTSTSGGYTAGGTSNSCDTGSWYTRTAGNAAYLTLFNNGLAYGNYWGSGMGGNDSWYHDGWWYVR